MKRRYLLPVIACLVLGAAAVALAGPQIYMPETEFNFGTVCQKALISHTFWIYSIGDDTLKVLKVVPGCGCTQAPLRDSVLAPGDSTRLDIFFKTLSYRGYVTKRPYIITNASTDHNYLVINSHLVPEPDSAFPLVLQPAHLDVSQFTETPRRQATFRIVNKSNKDYTLDLIDVADDFFTVEMPKMVRAGESAEGTVTVNEDKIKSDWQRSLTFKINDPNETRYTLPVKRMYKVKSGDAAKPVGLQ